MRIGMRLGPFYGSTDSGAGVWFGLIAGAVIWTLILVIAAVVIVVPLACWLLLNIGIAAVNGAAYLLSNVRGSESPPRSFSYIRLPYWRRKAELASQLEQVERENLQRAITSARVVTTNIRDFPYGRPDRAVPATERLLASFEGFSLVEPRSVRRGGPRVQTRVDEGTVLITDRAVRFSGTQKSVEWRLDKILKMTVGADYMVFSVSNRQLVSGFAADALDLELVGLVVDWAAQLVDGGEVSAIRQELELYAERLENLLVPLPVPLVVPGGDNCAPVTASGMSAAPTTASTPLPVEQSEVDQGGPEPAAAAAERATEEAAIAKGGATSDIGPADQAARLGGIAVSSKRSARNPATLPPSVKQRNIGKQVLLSIATLGFYGIYWAYRSHEDIHQHTGQGIGGQVGALIYSFAWILSLFVLPMEIKKMYESDGRQSPVGPGTAFWVLVFVIPWYVKCQSALNEYWASKGAPAAA